VVSSFGLFLLHLFSSYVRVRCIGRWDDLDEVTTFGAACTSSHALIPSSVVRRLTVYRVILRFASAEAQFQTGNGVFNRVWWYEESTINTIWHFDISLINVNDNYGTTY